MDLLGESLVLDNNMRDLGSTIRIYVNFVPGLLWLKTRSHFTTTTVEFFNGTYYIVQNMEGTGDTKIIRSSRRKQTHKHRIVWQGQHRCMYKGQRRQ